MPQDVVIILMKIFTLVEIICGLMLLYYIIKQDKKNKHYMMALIFLSVANNNVLRKDYIFMLISLFLGIYYWRLCKKDLEEERG